MMKSEDWCLVVWLVGVPVTFGFLFDNVLENTVLFFPMFIASIFWPVTALGCIGYFLAGLV